MVMLNSLRTRCRGPLGLITLMVFLCSGDALAQAQEDIYIELSASDDQVYVQQQLLLTVKLYYSDRVVRGELAPPGHPDAIIEQLGEQRQYRQDRDGRPYRVVERAYALFPQKPGSLQLPPIAFEGLVRHPRGHVYRLEDSASLFEIEVQDIPASFSGKTWLPASNLTMTEQGLGNLRQVQPGQDLTRILQLQAQGLPASSLPALSHNYPSALKAYPEPEQRNTAIDNNGISGSLQQTLALVPLSGQGNRIELPEIRIPWWDVEEDREKVAVLPARTLILAGEPDSGQAPEMPATVTRSSPAAEPQPPVSPPVNGGTPWLWPLLAGLLGLGWATTVAAWWLAGRRSRSLSQTHDTPGRQPDGEREQFERVCNQARSLDGNFFVGFPRWVETLTGAPCSTVDTALAPLEAPLLRAAIERWQRHQFGIDGASPPDSDELVRQLKHSRRQWQQRRSTASGSANHGRLPDLYPPGINP